MRVSPSRFLSRVSSTASSPSAQPLRSAYMRRVIAARHQDRRARNRRVRGRRPDRQRSSARRRPVHGRRSRSRAGKQLSKGVCLEHGVAGPSTSLRQLRCRSRATPGQLSESRKAGATTQAGPAWSRIEVHLTTVAAADIDEPARFEGLDIGSSGSRSRRKGARSQDTMAILEPVRSLQPPSFKRKHARRVTLKPESGLPVVRWVTVRSSWRGGPVAPAA